MAKNKFSLMDFVKRQGLENIIGVFGEECINEDGTIMSMADQAAVITHYLRLQNSGEYAKPYENVAKIILKYWEDLLEKEYEGKNIRYTTDLRKYLDSITSYAAVENKEIDALRKSNVAMMLLLLLNEVDVSEFDPYNFGIGYNELRYFSIDSNGNPVFESNNTRDLEGGEDAYRIFVWEELTDYEKPAIEDILKQIVKQKFAA